MFPCRRPALSSLLAALFLILTALPGGAEASETSRAGAKPGPAPAAAAEPAASLASAAGRTEAREKLLDRWRTQTAVWTDPTLPQQRAHLEEVAALYGLSGDELEQRLARPVEEREGPFAIGLAHLLGGRIVEGRRSLERAREDAAAAESLRVDTYLGLAYALEHHRPGSLQVHLRMAEERPDDAAAWQLAGWAAFGFGDFETAQHAFEKAHAAQRRRLGPEHLHTLSAALALGETLRERGFLEGAERLFLQVRKIRQQTLAPGQLDRLSVRLSLARVLKDRGETDRALAEMHAVLADFEQGPKGDTFLLLEALVTLRHALKEAEEPGAAALQRRAVDEAVRLYGPHHYWTSFSRTLLAFDLEDEGADAEATRLLTEVLDERRARLGPDHPHTLASVENLAFALEYEDPPEALLALRRQTAADLAETLPPQHPDLLVARGRLAAALDMAGDAAAGELFDDTLAVWEGTPAAESKEHLIVLTAYASHLIYSGRLDEAVSVLERVLEAYAKTRPDAPYGILAEVNAVSGRLVLFGRPEEAIALRETVLPLLREDLGGDDTFVQSVASSLDQMRDLAERVQRLRGSQNGPDVTEGHSMDLGDAGAGGGRNVLQYAMGGGLPFHKDEPAFEEGFKLRTAGDWAGEASVYEARIEELRRNRDQEDGGTVSEIELLLLAHLAAARMKLGQLEEAATTYEELRQLAPTVWGDDSPAVLQLDTNYANVLIQQGETERALALLEEGLERQQSLLGPSHPTTLLTTVSLGVQLILNGDPEAAITLLEPAFVTARESLGATSLLTLGLQANLGQAQRRAGRTQAAIETLENLVPLLDEVYGPLSPSANSPKETLLQAYMEAGDLESSLALQRRRMADFEEGYGVGSIESVTLQIDIVFVLHLLGRDQQAAALLPELVPLFEANPSTLSPDERGSWEVFQGILRVYPKLAEMMRQAAEAAAVGPGVENLEAALPAERQEVVEAKGTMKQGQAGEPPTASGRPEADSSGLRVSDGSVAEIGEAGDDGERTQLRLAQFHGTLFDDRDSALAEGSRKEADGDAEGAAAVYEARLDELQQLRAERQDATVTEVELLLLARLAAARAALGEWEAAAGHYETLQQVAPPVWGADSDLLFQVGTNFANVLIQMGQSDRAQELLESGLERQRRALPRGHPTLLLTTLTLGVQKILSGDTEAALLLLAPAAATTVESLGEDSPVTLAIQANYAEAVRRSGDPETAVGLLAAILPRIDAVYGPLSDSAQTPRNNLLAAYLDLGDFESALGQQERQMVLFEQAYGVGLLESAAYRINAGLLAHILGDTERGAALLAPFAPLLGEDPALLSPNQRETRGLLEENLLDFPELAEALRKAEH